MGYVPRGSAQALRERRPEIHLYRHSARAVGEKELAPCRRAVESGRLRPLLRRSVRSRRHPYPYHGYQGLHQLALHPATGNLEQRIGQEPFIQASGDRTERGGDGGRHPQCRELHQTAVAGCKGDRRHVAGGMENELLPFFRIHQSADGGDVVYDPR